MQKFKRSHLVIAAGATLIAVAGLVFVLEATNVTNLFNRGEPAITKEEQKLNLDNKAAVNATISEQPANTPSSDNSTTPAAQPYTPPSSADNIKLSASKASATSVTVYTELYGYSDGTCKLTATNGGATNSQEAPVIFQREFSMCAGFTIPVDALGLGTWDIKLSVLSGGTTIEKSITYEVR